MKKPFNSRRQTAVKGRSSALIVTIIVHVVFFLIAGTYVAMEVIERQEAKFEAKQVARPKIKLKKLQVPVKLEQTMKRQAPKLSQRMTASSAATTKSVDFKMPEVGGFGGGGGVNISGGLGGSLGFASTQVNVFGLRSSGEKSIFLLDCGNDMMVDEIGGISAYKIIKEELVSIVQSMPPTALFNVLVFDQNRCVALSANLLPATDANLQRFKKWIMPLNADRSRFGLDTLGFSGIKMPFEPANPVFNDQPTFMAGLGFAAKNGADVVYWLGNHEYLRPIYKEYLKACKKGEPLPYPGGWPPELPFVVIDYSRVGGEQQWEQTVARARAEKRKDDAKRLAEGKSVRVKPASRNEGDWLVETYFLGQPRYSVKSPREGKRYRYKGTDVVDYLDAIARKYNTSGLSASIGLKQKKMAVNVIHFCSKSGAGDQPLEIIRDVSKRTGGDYLRVEGGAAVR